jgi:DNA polymerase epsilon subunit 4
MVSKALELFIESLAVESFSYTAHAKKKTVSKEDVTRAIGAVDSLAFLDGAMD